MFKVGDRVIQKDKNVNISGIDKNEIYIVEFFSSLYDDTYSKVYKGVKLYGKDQIYKKSDFISLNEIRRNKINKIKKVVMTDNSGYINKELFNGLSVKDFRKIEKFMSLLFTDIKSELIWTLYNNSVYIYHRYSNLYIQERYISHNNLKNTAVTKNEILSIIRKNKLKRLCSKI